MKYLSIIFVVTILFGYNSPTKTNHKTHIDHNHDLVDILNSSEILSYDINCEDNLDLQIDCPDCYGTLQRTFEIEYCHGQRCRTRELYRCNFDDDHEYWIYTD
jgi:hypothetical protein